MTAENKDFFEALSMLEHERGITAEYLIEKIKAAIIIAVKKNYEVEEDHIRVDIDPDTGRFDVALIQDIVADEDWYDEHAEIGVTEARKIRSSYEVGDRIITPLKTRDFGRIAAQTAKHVIRQGLREGERSLQCSEMQSRAHEIITGTVTAVDASGNIGRASVDIDSYNVDHKFSDINDYWAATYVDFLYNANITTGYSDGTFRPNQNISRAQFAVMLYRYLKLDENKYADVSLPFADLDNIPEYAIPAVKALYTEGVISGAEKNGRLYFNPNNALTRAQAAAMIGRTQAKGYALANLTFTDSGKIPGYADYYIRTMAAQGVINGYSDGSFKPHSNITRGQMAKILYNLM